jgi:hypothetical protein
MLSKSYQAGEPSARYSTFVNGTWRLEFPGHPNFRLDHDIQEHGHRVVFRALAFLIVLGRRGGIIDCGWEKSAEIEI